VVSSVDRHFCPEDLMNVPRLMLPGCGVVLSTCPRCMTLLVDDWCGTLLNWRNRDVGEAELEKVTKQRPM
jgi:hypothetical protein